MPILIFSRVGACPPCSALAGAPGAHWYNYCDCHYCVCLYALRVLRHYGLSDVCLHTVFRAVVIAKLLYACTAWSGYIMSTLSSAAANAVATVIQMFLPSTSFSRSVTIGCFTNSVVTLDTHYITFSHHPPRHHNTTTSAVHQHITDNYQPAQATLLMATSSHVYCTKTVIEFLSQCDYTLYFTRRIPIVTAVRFVIVDFKGMNE